MGDIFCEVLQNKSWKGFLKPFSEGILDTFEGVASPWVTLTLSKGSQERPHTPLVDDCCCFSCPAAFSSFKQHSNFTLGNHPYLTLVPHGCHPWVPGVGAWPTLGQSEPSILCPNNCLRDRHWAMSISPELLLELLGKRHCVSKLARGNVGAAGGCLSTVKGQTDLQRSQCREK